MTKLQPAPDAVLHLIKCGCVKEKCSSNRCKCRKAGLPCTDLCNCTNEEDDDPCSNKADDTLEVNDYESSDEEMLSEEDEEDLEDDEQ